MVDCVQCGKPVPDDAADCPACHTPVTRPGDTMASPAPPSAPRPGAPLAEAKPVLDGVEGRSVTGRYTKVRKLGGGGMGTVYLAEQTGVGNQVALKYLAPQLSHDEGLVRRFLQEGKVSLEVHHPGAAQLLDMGQDADGQLFLAFEYVEGQDVRELLEKEGRLPLEEARLIALRVAEVLAYAHDRGIVHRDIKPENVRVRRDLAMTHVKVLDFGIARLTQAGGAKLTREGGVAGTPRYMAPEQIQGAAIDGKADVYALGLLLFEMLSGQPAFSAENVAQLFHQQLTAPLPKLAVIDPRFEAPSLDLVLARACAKSPGDRFPDMKSFIAALQGAEALGWPPPSADRTAPLRRDLATPFPSSATAAPPPVASPVPPSAAHSRVPLAVGLGGVLLGGLLAAAVLLRPADSVAPVVAAPAQPSGCPGLDLYDPSLTSLSVPELEQKVLESRVMMPSMAHQQLDTLKSTVMNNAPDKRDCMYKAMLVGSVAGEATTLRLPQMWGMDKPPKELELMFFELPTRKKWGIAQKKAVLARIESLFIANLKKKIPEDGDYWRRMYFGIELRCEATDEALLELNAQRPDSCLNVSP